MRHTEVGCDLQWTYFAIKADKVNLALQDLLLVLCLLLVYFAFVAVLGCFCLPPQPPYFFPHDDGWTAIKDSFPIVAVFTLAVFFDYSTLVVLLI